jgi:hypothetical protein
LRGQNSSELASFDSDSDDHDHRGRHCQWPSANATAANLNHEWLTRSDLELRLEAVPALWPVMSGIGAGSMDHYGPEKNSSHGTKFF